MENSSLEKMTVISHRQKEGGCLKNIWRKLQEWKAYDTQMYIDMLAGEDEDFEVPSDH